MRRITLHLDEIIAIVLFIISSSLFIYHDLTEIFFNFTRTYEYFELDTLLAILMCFSLILIFYSYKKFTDLKINKLMLHKTSTLDNLTSLENRESFCKDIEKDNESIAILINIIDFKSINKILGFSKSDEFLKVFSEKLEKIVFKNTGSKLYRIYGDEFAFIYNKINKINDICQIIKDEFEENNLIFENHDFHISLNLSYSKDEPKFLTATLAMQECKKSLDKQIIAFEKKYFNFQENKDTLNMLKVIKDAISNDNIIPVYHSIVDNNTEEIYKYETLARIKQKDKILLSPYFFINLSKRFKLYPYITKNIIKKSFSDFKYNNMNFSINFSYLDIHNEEILEYFYEVLKTNSQTAKRLTIEILETENISSYEELLSFRKIIKKYGCKLAIDDFGSGYSNWINILQIKPDFIKLDGSIIQNLLLNNEDTVKLVKTIVSFAKENGIKTIAEFVSCKELALLVKELEIDYSQGFYYSQPLEIKKINIKK